MANERELDEALAEQRDVTAWSRRVTDESLQNSRMGLAATERIASALERIAAAIEERNA